MSDSVRELSRVEYPPEGAAVAPADDLVNAVMAMPVAQQNVALAEYKDRRDNFREWLLQQLVEGLHYGVPPGISVKEQDRKRWRNKPSLYKAGAEFLVDLCRLREVYESDESAWRMLGGQAGTVVIRCRLISRATGVEIGQGIGAGKVGAKSADENKAVKDAQKRAKVAAVLNSYGLSDLFTQDMEDGGPEAHPNPPRDENHPRTEPRGQRRPPPEPAVSVDQLAELAAAWKQANAQAIEFGEIADPQAAYKTWILARTGRQFNPGQRAEWTPADVAKCREALKLDGGTV